MDAVVTGQADPPPPWPAAPPPRWRTYRRGEPSPWRSGEPGPGRRVVSVRLGDDEITELRAAADRSGLRLSGYMARDSGSCHQGQSRSELQRGIVCLRTQGGACQVLGER